MDSKRKVTSELTIKPFHTMDYKKAFTTKTKKRIIFLSIEIWNQQESKRIH